MCHVCVMMLFEFQNSIFIQLVSDIRINDMEA
jgi:hypothetical protein